MKNLESCCKWHYSLLFSGMYFGGGHCVSWFDTQSFDPLNSLLRKVLLSSSHFTDEQTKSQRHLAPSSQSTPLTVQSAEETATQRTLKGSAQCPAPKGAEPGGCFPGRL